MRLHLPSLLIVGNAKRYVYVIISRFLRDYLVDTTQDKSWPADVEAFPFRELAREHPDAFLRAYDAFRMGTPLGFTRRDLILVGASAALGVDLFSLTDPFQAMRLAFHCKEGWEGLSQYFDGSEVEVVQEHLSHLQKPLGDMFGKRGEMARQAATALIVLSRHLDDPAKLLPNLNPSLAPWQDTEPIIVPSIYPTWFEEELALFDSMVGQPFQNIFKRESGLEDAAKRKEFSVVHCWSRKLRELVLLDGEIKHGPKLSLPNTEDLPLESEVYKFRSLLAELEKLVAEVQAECNRLRILHASQLKIDRFVEMFRDKGFYRLPLLADRLRFTLRRVCNIEKHPGFETDWQPMQARAENLLTASETLAKDVDFLLGRFLEGQYANVVGKQISATNQLIENVIHPRRLKSPSAPVAIVLLDGLRYDLWRDQVRPYFERRYSVDEQIALAMLPSETRISRFGFFSGLRARDFFGKRYPGGETAACNDLLKRLNPSHLPLEPWDLDQGQMPFAFRTGDGKFFGAVLDFADAVGHAGMWDMDQLAELLQTWLKQLDQFMRSLPPECQIWITSDHGQVKAGPAAIDIPDALIGPGGVGYRAAWVKERLPGFHEHHAFYLKATDLGYAEEGFWSFPKPGYSFRTKEKLGEARRRFKPTDHMRHGGLSAFEIFVPLALLTSRKQEVKVRLVPKVEGVFKEGVAGHILVEVSANCDLPGQIQLVADTDGIDPVWVQGVGVTAQIVRLPFTPLKSGRANIVITAYWGSQPLAPAASLTLDVAARVGRPPDALDAKLKRLFGEGEG